MNAKAALSHLIVSIAAIAAITVLSIAGHSNAAVIELLGALAGASGYGAIAHSSPDNKP